MYRWNIFLMFAFVIQSISAYRILLMNSPIKSQTILMAELAVGLLEHDHEVTIVVPKSLPIPDMMIDPRVNIEKYEVVDDDLHMKKCIFDYAFNRTWINLYRFLAAVTSQLEYFGEALINDEELFEKLSNKHFDFAVLAPPLIHQQTLLAYRLGVPFAYMGIECGMSWMALPSMSPSYVPSILLGSRYSDHMSLAEKTVNSLLYAGFVLRIYLGGGTARVEKFIRDKPIVPFSELERSAALCLRVRTSVLDTARPQLPNAIDVGKLVVSRENEVMPVKMETFLDEAVNGVVLVSFGSVLDELPDAVIEKMTEAFMKTPYRVIWKREKQSHNKLDAHKFLVVPWLPQVQVLKHNNTKAFVSHCGYGSVVEAVFYGIPIVAMPIFGDQPANAALLEHKGYGRHIDLSTFSADELSQAIIGVVDGPETAAVKRAAAILHELPSDREKAVYWIEHVIKHGAQHLRSSVMDMSVVEYLMLDVAGVILLSISVLLFLCRGCLRCVYRTCCQRKGALKTKKD